MTKPKIPDDVLRDEFSVMLYNLSKAMQEAKVILQEYSPSEAQKTRHNRALHKAYWRGWNDSYESTKSAHPRVKWKDEE